MTFKNIGPLHSHKIIKGLLCGSLHLSLTMLTLLFESMYFLLALTLSPHAPFHFQVKLSLTYCRWEEHNHQYSYLGKKEKYLIK